MAQVADIRKANNMWAQDNIHLKKVLLIPTAKGAAPDGATSSSPKKIQQRRNGSTSPTPLSRIY